MNKILAAFFILGVFITSCNPGPDKTNAGPAVPPPPTITFSVANTFAHDTSYFTEGLEFYKGKLIESTGLNKKSKLVQYDIVTGVPEKEIKLDDKFFGEGITVFRDTIYQLTYKEGIVHVYDAKTFNKIKELPYTNGEGWGLTHDSAHIIGTNSGNSLHYYQPTTFKLVKSVGITERGDAAININELEYINGYIYANQWQAPYILKIDPVKGEVIAKMDLTSIIQQEKAQNPEAMEFNGIAYNPETKKFYVTGKYWSKIYELQLSL
jgi:glutamine cyclotransferase